MALVMLLAAAMLPITRAAASTTVSGDADTNQSLTIDPGSGELTTQLDVNAALPVMFIQKMPVTKIVRQVTIGNFGLDPSCTGPSSLQLYVREHQDGDLDNSTQVSYSTTVPTVPAGAPARITWQIRDTKLMKGRGYSFRIQRNDTTDCRWLRTMTWGHNSSMVNPGPTTCANGPLVGNGSPMQRRMWHVAGVDDRFPGCVDRPSGSSSFEPTMPTGWLVSRYGSVWDSATAACLPSFCPPSPVVDYACKDNADDKLASDYGAEDVPYSPVLPDDKIHYVCRWGQWAPFGSTVPDGWYYAVPWIGGAGGAYPRDRYLRLDTIDYASYLQAYSPTLKYENTELYYADRAGEITDNYGARSYGSIYSNKLRTGDDGVLADANPNSGPFYPNGPWSFLSMDYLGSTYADGRQAASGDHIDEDNEDYQGDAAWMHDNGYGNYIYGVRSTTPPGSYGSSTGSSTTTTS